jgi:hypothetical protein
MLWAVTLFAATSLAQRAISAEDPHANLSETCRTAMARDWRSVVQGNWSDDTLKNSISTLVRLEANCSEDPRALMDIASLHAKLDLLTNDPAGAISLLEKYPAPKESDRDVENQWIYLGAAERLKDAVRFRTARDAFLQAHEARLLSRPGVRKIEHFQTTLADVDVWMSAWPNMRILFIASPKDGAMWRSVVFHLSGESSPGKVWVSVDLNMCSQSWNNDWKEFGYSESIPYDTAKTRALELLSEKGAFSPLWDENIDTGCTLSAELAPAFGRPPQFIGDEYTTTDTLDEKDIAALMSGAPSQVERAVNYVISHPDAVEPMTYVSLVQYLAARGDNARAAFWYYVWQIRISAWAEADSTRYGELSGTFATVLGPQINEWAGSDPMAMHDLMLRAITFERKIPLYAGRPDGISETDWRRFIEHSRVRHDEVALNKQSPTSGPDLEKYLKTRRANGLYVGPWRAPGSPLPAEWR